MKVVINTAHQRFGGAVQVALSFIYECRKFSEHEYYIWLGPGVGKLLRREDFLDNFHFSSFDFGPIDIKVAWRINRLLQKEERKIRPDVIISTSGPSYFHSRSPQIIGFNLPLYIYPESPYVHNWPLLTQLRMLLKKKVHFFFFKRDAKAFLVQTDDVNNRVRKTLNVNNVYTVSNTHNHFYNEWRKYPNKLHRKEVGFFRFVTISSWYPHKDLALIPKIQGVLEERGINKVEFVLTLKPQDFRKYLPINRLPRIYNVGPVAPEECPSLYDECDGMILPTLAECFSASYPEAMVMEKPIITTDLPFARNICGSGALFFRPCDPHAAADKIELLINSVELRQKLVLAGKEKLKKFDSASQRAEKYLSIGMDMAKGNER